MKVLIVDADEAFRANLATQLSRRGVEVLVTDDGEQAGRMACSDKADAVLLGVSSHDRSLVAHVGRVRKACPRAEVILINHSGDVPLSIEAMKMGAFAELAAPVDMEELEDKLRLIRERRGGRSGR
jgi:DNA-binding NtrC family response regulator